MLMHSIVQYDMFQRTLDILLLIIKIYYSSFNFMESKDQSSNKGCQVNLDHIDSEQERSDHA